MKKRTLITGLTLLCAGLLFFASCSNLLNSQKEAASSQSGENGKVTFNGSICVTGVQPATFSHADKSRNNSSVSRSALPSFSVTGSYYYYADASQTDGSGLRSINSINNPDAFDTTDGVTFSMDLSVGTWKIECGIHHEASPTPLLIDTYQSSLSAETLVLNHTFYPKPVQSGKENGLIDLSMTIPPSVKFVSSICSNTDWKVDVAVDGPANTVTIKTKDMNNHNYTKSGSYEVTFNFYDENAILLYSTVQIINVFDYLTTNTWVSDESSLIDESGNFILSNDLIAQFKRTTFYVGQTAAATSAGKTASNDTGKGSAYEPLATIRKAASIIAATGDGSKDYRIFVSGTLEGAQEIPDTLTTGSAKSVTIQGYDGLDSSGEPKDAIHITSQGAALYVTSGVPVTLRNLKILGSQNPAIETIGLGLEANKNVNVTISDGVLITGHQTAGVYIGEGAKLSMTGGKISGNHASKGAGVTNGGIFIMTGGEISGNTASEKGGAVANSGTFNISGFAYIPYGAGGSTGTGKNDIYLASGKTVRLGNTLKAHNADKPIAITPHTWKRRTTVVQLVNNFSESYKNYFTYTQDGWNSKFSEDKKSIAIDAPIYVAGTGHAVCTADGSDTPSANGLKGAPFATIAKAIEVMDDNTTDYTIYIDGTVTGTQEIPNTLTNTNSGTYKAQSLIIVGVNGLDENKVPRDELNGSQSGTTLKVDSNVSVSITNLKITGGNGSNGGGLSVSSSSTVKLLDGTLITGNEATKGGGVYNQGSLYMSGSAMVGKSTNSIATSSSNGNKATESGAGIYSISGAKLYLGYTSWTSTSVNSPSELTGGVCGNYLSNSSSSSAYGGGIFNVGQLYIGSGNISYNYAINGAGIYTESDITMTGGTIKGNEGNSSGVGGGVCVYNEKTFTMSGDSKILDNKNMKFGAGIYLYYNNCKLVMKGGEISGNIAETHGGAVYMHDLSSSNHSDMQISGSSYIPYGGAVNNNDIYMLDFNAKITITGSLSDRQANNLIYITPNTYTNGKTILEAGTGVNLADEVEKFALTPNENDPTAGWFITSDGTLGTPLDAELVTSEDYATVTRIKVTSAAGMNQIAALSNEGKNFEGKTITLFDDVTLASNFTPIGSVSDNAFKGTFDGNNKTVSGLSGQNALFNYVGGGTIKDLTVEGSSTNAGIVNRLNSGRIEGCRSYVSVTHTGGSEAGGIAAFCLSGTIINCVNYGTVISSGDGLGGILGYQQGSGIVDSCVNKGAVQSTGAGKTGGIAGLAFGIVRNCINTGEVSASTAVVGGIVGNEHCALTDRGVLNCANLASVSGTYCVGGIAGVCDLSSSLNYIAIVKNCFNAGTVSITDSSKISVGGVIGEILTGGSGTCTLVSNYYKTGTAANGIGADNGVTVAAPSAMVPSIDQMNEWVNANNSVELYKTWISKVVAGVPLPVPDVGYEW